MSLLDRMAFCRRKHQGKSPVNRFAQRALALLTATSLIACSTLQPISDSGAGSNRAQRQAQKISIGTSVMVRPISGAPFEMSVTSVSAEQITGTIKGEAMQIQYADIASFEHKTFNFLGTALIVLGIIAVGQYAGGVSKLTNPQP
jgi:hypothetical protein